MNSKETETQDEADFADGIDILAFVLAFPAIILAWFLLCFILVSASAQLNPLI